MTYKHHQYRTVTPQSEVPLCLQRTPSNVTSGSIMSITLRTPNYGFPAARLTLAAAETREGRPREPGPLAVTNPLTVGTTHTCRGENNRVKSRGHTSRAHKSPTKCRVLFKLLKLWRAPQVHISRRLLRTYLSSLVSKHSSSANI